MLVSHCTCSHTCLLAGACIARYLYLLYFHSYLTCMPGPCFLIVCLALASCVYVLPFSRSVCAPQLSVVFLTCPPFCLDTMSLYASPLTYHTRISCWVSCCCPALVSGLFPRPSILFVCLPHSKEKGPPPLRTKDARMTST